MTRSVGMRRAGLIAGLLATCMALAVSACGGDDNDDGGGESGSVTLTLMAVSDQEKSVEAVRKNFEQENPNIKITAKYAASPDEVGSAYSTQFQAGNAPDILWLFPGSSTSITALHYAAAGRLVDLSGRDWASDLTAEFAIGAVEDDKVYAYPTAASIVGVMDYNVDLFKELGVEVPETWSELLDVCGTIKDAGKIPIAWSPGDNGLSFPLTGGLMGQAVYAEDPEWDDKRANGEVTFADSSWRNVFEKTAEMKDAGCFSSGAQGTDGVQAATQFANGEAAMWPTGSAQSGVFLAVNPDINYSMFPLPPDQKGGTVSIMYSTANLYGVNAATSGDKREAALKFIDFLAQPEQTEAYNKASGSILVSAEQLESGDIPVDEYPQLELVAPALAESAHMNPFSIWPNAEVSAALNDGNTSIFSGQQTIDETLEAMDAAYDKGSG